MDNFNIHNWRLKVAINELEARQCPDCGCKMEGTMCNECGYMEEATFTDKHDDNPELKGGQKDLPDEVQAGILNKEGEDHEVFMAQNSLKAIISSASQLMSKVGDDERDIPGWIQDHITNAENYIEQANQGFHELEPAVKDVDMDAMDMVAEEASTNKYNIKQTASGRYITNPDKETYDLLKNKGSKDLLVKKLIANMLGNPNEKIYGARALPDGSILVMENNTINELKSNKYIKFENDEYVGPIPYLDEKLIEDYLISIVEPTRINDIKKFISDDKNGWGKALDKFDLDDDKIDKITEKQVEEFATEMASWYLESAADEFPFKNKTKMAAESLKLMNILRKK